MFVEVPVFRLSRCKPILGQALLILLALVISATSQAKSVNDTRANTVTRAHSAPQSNAGKPFRIAYYEGGPHHNYHEYLSAVARGLMKLGWIARKPMPSNEPPDQEVLWKWLVKNASNEYVEFVRDGYYTANWDNTERHVIRSRVIDRLNKVGDIDLIIAMGTWAGKDLATDEHNTPTVVMSASDPVGSGIIKSTEDSGMNHVHARVDPYRYERQVRLFHDIIGFKKLGVAYENTVDGRNYAAMDMVEKVAHERGFEVVPCHTKSDIADQALAAKSVLDCFDRLSREVDAIYVTLQGGVNRETIPKLVDIANARRIPTFSQSGSQEVSYGFLLSISRPSFEPVGDFLATTVAKILNGASPRQLNQLFEERPNIAINLKTAELIGLYLYADVLAAADELYEQIRSPE